MKFLFERTLSVGVSFSRTDRLILILRIIRANGFLFLDLSVVYRFKIKSDENPHFVDILRARRFKITLKIYTVNYRINGLNRENFYEIERWWTNSFVWFTVFKTVRLNRFAFRSCEELSIKLIIYSLSTWANGRRSNLKKFCSLEIDIDSSAKNDN